MVAADTAAGVARAAERDGLAPEAFVEDALRLALELGPGGVARTRKALALEQGMKASAKAS